MAFFTNFIPHLAANFGLRSAHLIFSAVLARTPQPCQCCRPSTPASSPATYSARAWTCGGATPGGQPHTPTLPDTLTTLRKRLGLPPTALPPGEPSPSVVPTETVKENIQSCKIYSNPKKSHNPPITVIVTSRRVEN